MFVKTDVWGDGVDIDDQQLRSPAVLGLSKRARKQLIQIVAIALETRRGYVIRRWVRVGQKVYAELHAAGFITLEGHHRDPQRQVLRVHGYKRHGNRWRAPWPNSRREYARVAKQLRAVVIARDVWCVRCMSMKNLTVDHIIPIALGGSNDLDNLQAMCRSCNCRKGARTWPERVF